MLATASTQPAVRGHGLAAGRRKATWLPNAAILFAKRLKLDKGHFLIPRAGAQHGHLTGAQEAPQEVEMAQLAPPVGTAGTAPRPPAPASAGGSGAAHKHPSAAVGPVLVAFRVLGCQLAYGEHLRLVGSCAELGTWGASAAPALSWREGNLWEGQVALPPGQHELKLVRCSQDGAELAWEAGANRTLVVPELAVSAQGSLCRPVLSVTCRWGDTAANEVVADRAHLQAVADAAAARVADLMRRKTELAARLASLEAEVLESEVRIANTAAGAERLLNAELARQVGQRRQRAQRLELAAAAAELQAEQRSAAAAAALPSQRQSQSSSRGGQHAGAASASFIGAALASAAASLSAVVPSAASRAAAPAGMQTVGGAVAQVQTNGDGSLQFCFADSGAEEGSHQPSALDLAKARLAAQLPATAAAALERRLGRMDAAGAGCHSSPHSTGSSSSRSTLSSPQELLSTAVSAAGLVGAAGPTHQRLARKVNLLRQEVAAGARQAADLSDQFELLLSLGAPAGQRSSGSNRSGEQSTHSSGRRSSSSAGLPTKQHGRSTQLSQPTAAHSAAVAPTSTTAAAAAPAAVSSGAVAAAATPAVPAVQHHPPTPAAKTSSGLVSASSSGSTRQSHSRHSSVRARAKAAVRVAAAAAAAPAGASGRQPAVIRGHHIADATTRGSFPVAAACVAAHAVFTAGSLVWGAGRSVVPRQARGAADTAFWMGYAALAAIPLLS